MNIYLIGILIQSCSIASWKTSITNFTEWNQNSLLMFLGPAYPPVSLESSLNMKKPLKTLRKPVLVAPHKMRKREINSTRNSWLASCAL